MLILTLRTDKPEAEIGLFENDLQLAYDTWHAHRELAETIHLRIAEKLRFMDKEWSDIGGIVAYQGPGSFTGLRIGLSVANSLSYAQNIPIIGASGGKWLEKGIKRLLQNKGSQQVLPDYGAEVHITRPKK